MSWGIYLHLPFCRSRCRYCAFYSGEPQALLPELVGLFETEIRLRRSEPPSVPAGSVYFGGGTPGLLHPDQVASVLDGIVRHWPLAADAEVTLEVNPGDVLHWERLLAAGVTRLSIGVQGLEDRLLQRLGRRHTAEQARAAVKSAADAGFARISADLILGLPDLVPEALCAWVETLVRDGANHLSLYSLELHPGTPLAEDAATGRFRAAGDSLEERQYQAVVRTCDAQELFLYEVSNFARPGQQCRHNLNYWNGGTYLGLGPGAHSYLPDAGSWGRRYWNHSDLGAYLAALRGEHLPSGDDEWLSRKQALLERLFLDFRRPTRISPQQLADRFHLTPEVCAKVFKQLTAKSMFREDLSGFFIPTRKTLRRADGLAVTIQEQLRAVK